jgi:dynein heavy chain
VAQRGAMLFFLLNSLSKIHAFYQFSLNAFVTVFGRGLDSAPGGKRSKVWPFSKLACLAHMLI